MLCEEMSLYTTNFPPLALRNANKNSIPSSSKRSSPSAVVQVAFALQTDENGNLPELKVTSGSGGAISRLQTPESLLYQVNTVGIIGGVSVLSTLIFLEKLVWWSLKGGQKESVPFVVCSDPALSKELPPQSSAYSLSNRDPKTGFEHGPMVENLKSKRVFLERSGARCIVMPCYISHAWHREISDGCSLPFLHVGDCVAWELKEAKLKPVDAGANVRIGVLAAHEISAAVFSQKLKNQGFDVVLPDKATMSHIVLPAVEAFNRRDTEGARNLLTIAIHVLLVQAARVVVIASDEMRGILPLDDPLQKKCIDPMDALARGAIKWSKSTEAVP